MIVLVDKIHRCQQHYAYLLRIDFYYVTCMCAIVNATKKMEKKLQKQYEIRALIDFSTGDFKKVAFFNFFVESK